LLQSIIVNAQNPIPEIPQCFESATGGEGWPIVEIKVNIHYVAYDQNGVIENFYPGAADDDHWENGNYYGRKMIEDANAVMSNLQPNPIGLAHSTGDSGIRYSLYSDPDNPADQHGGIWYWDQLPSDYPYGDDVINILAVRNTASESGTGGLQSGSTLVFVYNWHRKAKLEVNNPFDEIAGILRHEVGHVAGLCHSYFCGNPCGDIDANAECNSPSGGCDAACGSNGADAGCDPNGSTGNNIMGAGEDNDFNALSPCQWKQYYSYFAFEEDRPAEIIGIACTLPYVLQPTEIIPTGEQRVWNTAQILDRHIIIEPNASLTINCVVLAAPDATIQVRRGAKLTIQHGSIRRLCEDTPWKSIWVEGAYNQAHPNVDINLPEADYANPNNVAGAVLLFNAELIGAKTAIRAGRRTEPWNQDYYGGLVIAEYSKFINCRRGVEFMRYVLEDNGSYFSDCIFEEVGNSVEGSAGVTIWANRNITFDRCEFKNMDKYAIHGEDYGVIINESNKFTDNRIGVSIYNSFPLSGAPIIVGSANNDPAVRNEFGNDVGGANSSDIVVESANLISQLVIKNNIFTRSIFPINIFGEAGLELRENTFRDHFSGVRISSTGGLSSLVRCNHFLGIDNLGELVISGNNGGLDLLHNNFSSSFIPDVRLFDGSSISTAQGNEGFPADNCFSDVNRAFSVSPNTAPFTYFASDTVPATAGCVLIPDNSSTIYTVELTTDNSTGEDYCESLEGIGGEEDDPPTVAAFSTKRQEVTVAYQAYQAHPYNTQLEVAYHIAAKEKNKMLQRLLKGLLGQEDYSTAEAVLIQDGGKMAQRMLFGLQLLQEDFTAARQLLTQYPLQTVDDQYFVDIMDVNIDRLQQGTMLYSLPAAKKSRLIEIAQTESMFRSYARALLMILEDMEFEIELPVDSSHALIRTNPGSSSNVAKQNYQLFPNPAQEYINLVYPFTERPLQLQLTGLYDGRVHLQVQLPIGSTHALGTQDLSNGLYQVTFFDPERGEVLYSSRIVIIK
jgi:hypothetical protein